MIENRNGWSAQVISLEEYRATRSLDRFRQRVGSLRECVADMRKAAEREAPLLLFRRDPPH